MQRYLRIELSEIGGTFIKCLFNDYIWKHYFYKAERGTPKADRAKHV